MSRHGATLSQSVPRPAESKVREARESVPDSVWPASGLRWLGLIVLVAGVVLAVAWYGCSGETTWRVQVRWFGLGVLACALNALGALVWLGTGVRTLRRERAWVTVELRRRDLMSRQPVSEQAEAVGLVTSPRMRRYHRPACPLMVGKSVLAVTDGAHGLQACGVCES